VYVRAGPRKNLHFNPEKVRSRFGVGARGESSGGGDSWRSNLWESGATDDFGATYEDCAPVAVPDDEMAGGRLMLEHLGRLVCPDDDDDLVMLGAGGDRDVRRSVPGAEQRDPRARQLALPPLQGREGLRHQVSHT
jgi:hypothetical protein